MAAADWHRPEFAGLPLAFAARLARGSARLGRLRQLAPGDVVTLDTLVGEPSWLIAEGVAVGAGEIVESGGRLCLRITRLGVPRE